MAVKVAINGFGRIGRLVFRAIVDQGLLGDEVEVVAVNDLVPANNLAYLLKYDTTQGRFNGTVEAEGDDTLVVNGQSIKCLALREVPANLPWGDRHRVDRFVRPRRKSPRSHRRGREESDHFRSG